MLQNKVKLECFYPNEKLQNFTPFDVFRYYHFSYMGKQVTILHNSYGYSVRCLGFAPCFFHERYPIDAWYQVTPYFKDLFDAKYFFELAVCDCLFGKKLNYGCEMLENFTKTLSSVPYIECSRIYSHCVSSEAIDVL